jgi:hypothetical protein
MEEELQPTWASRELPILRAALRRLDAGERLADLEEIRQEAGLTPDETWAAVQALQYADPPYIEVELAGGWSDEASGIATSVSERARRELGTWPSPASLVDELAAAFAQAADAEQEPEKRTKLRALADGLAGMARDIAVGVLSRRIGDI